MLTFALLDLNLKSRKGARKHVNLCEVALVLVGQVLEQLRFGEQELRELLLLALKYLNRINLNVRRSVVRRPVAFLLEQFLEASAKFVHFRGELNARTTRVTN